MLSNGQTFDVSIFEIFFPWFRGRTLVGCTRAQMLDDLPATIAALEVDAAELTPTVVSNLLHGRSSVPGLKLLLTIGEMLTQYVIDEYGGNEKQESMLWAMYGPTEAAIHCTLQPHLPTSSSTGTIGYPLDTVSAFVVALSTEELTASPVEILPYGETGELAIGGPQIAEEYLNRSDLTGTSFVVHPVYGRLYRTGDRAKMRDNGTIECLGRVVAGQVKLRGQRVELGEIEQAVMRVRGCRTAIVMVFQESLIAFCATGSQRVSRSTVFETCKRWLPAFMVPLDVCFVDNMPQLPSGKIDRKELEERYLRTLHSNGTSPTLAFNPDDSVAHNVSEIVRQHTARNIGLHSNLALVGLDSLRSIRIASALRREGYGLGAMDVLSATNLGDLIAICRKRRELNGLQQSAMELASTDACSEVLQSQHWSDIACIVPCTPLQEAMLAETIAKPSAYCNWIEVDLSIPYTYEEIQSALQSLGQATEILRTGFVVASQRAGAFNQVIWKDLLSSQIQEVACFSRDYSVRSDSDLLRPFNVQVKVTLERPKLLFRIHHALYDGWSFDLLLCDLHNYLHGKSVAPRPQFQSLARYFNCLAQSENHTSAMGFWTDFLKDYIPPVLPNYNGKLVRDLGLRRFSARSAVHRDTLFERARDLAINPQVFFQAATAYILRLYTGSTDVVLGNVTSGRTVPVDGVEDIIGPCIASVPFRINFEHCLDVRDILHSTQACNRDSLHHSALPLRDIARAANIRPGARLFDVLFVWQQSLTTESEMALDAQVIDSADDLECKLTLEFEPRKDHISLRATFDSSTIPEHQIELLSRQIDEVVQLFLKDFDCAVTEFNRCFTTCSLSIANPNPYQQPIEHGPSHAVEQWASRDPQKEAVSFGHIVDGVMVIKDAATYGMLNSRANQLARVLADHGVGHDQLVGIIMEKSVDLYISILAVLKLGCGYLPLVPDTPTERIKTILRDAQVTVCISESSFSHVLHQDISVSVVDVDLIELSSYSEKNLNIPYNGKHLAYAVFTSGSTGTPKGVLVTQDNLMSNLQCLSSIYPLSATSRMLQSCSQ
jgi:non-ribosomal peptide synthetase component F/aryl carrier-like protein